MGRRASDPRLAWRGYVCAALYTLCGATLCALYVLHMMRHGVVCCGQLSLQANEVQAGIEEWGIVTHSSGARIYAMEVDGFGEPSVTPLRPEVADSAHSSQCEAAHSQLAPIAHSTGRQRSHS